MSLTIQITEIYGREILDSRGNPTVEVEVTAQTETTGKKTVGRESVPSGASTGRFEAIELRDGTERYFGLSVQKVVEHINTRIRQEIVGLNVLDQVCIDRKLVELDGTRFSVYRLPAQNVRLLHWICRCTVILGESMPNVSQCR